MTTDEFEDDDIESWKFMPVGEKVRTGSKSSFNDPKIFINFLI
jgi:hypothetical protein